MYTIITMGTMKNTADQCGIKINDTTVTAMTLEIVVEISSETAML
jgi:hypothetical protein